MPVSPANRDSIREQSFALSAQGYSYRDIAKRLNIDKNTVWKYVHQERQRRSHDRDAEAAIRDGVAVLRASIQDSFEHLLLTHGTGPMGAIAKGKLLESIRRSVRDMILVYGVSLPRVDGEEISIHRLMEQVQREVDAPITGYPDVSEDGIYERSLKSPTELRREWEEWEREQERRGEEREADRDLPRRAERRMEEEFEASPFQSWQELLDSADYADEGY